jgi:hypothetical protein
MDEKKPRRAVLVLITVVLLAVVGAAFYLAASAPHSSDARLVKSIAEQFVRQQIAQTGTPHFSNDGETNVERLPEGKYLVTGWVEVVTPDGGMSHSSYNCTIYRNTAGDWVADQVNVLPNT